ncbi:MAG: BACON domain-containing protein [Tannerella sp.]|nr:BACON domain-containing protein [Tannerella sp.]
MSHYSNSNTTSWWITLSGFIGLVFLGMTCMTGCEKSDPSPTLEVSPDSLALPFSGGEASFTVTSNTSWTVSCEEEAEGWLEFSTHSGSGNGTVTITAIENAVKFQRTATITVSGDGITQTINITQGEFEPSLNVSEESLSFSYSNEQKSFSITSNTRWKVSSSESWLSVSPTSGSGDSTITVSSSINSLTSDRTATVTVSGDGITRTISVTQAKSPLSVSTNSLSFSSEVKEQTFTIQFNASWTVSSDASWLTVSPASGNGNGTVKVKAAANSSAWERTATITIKGGSFSAKISVTQSRGPLSVSSNSLFLVSGGEEETFSVNSNTSWTVRSNATWLTVSPASGSGEGTVKVKAAANPSTSDRTATITVSGGGVSESISVKQYGTPTGSAMFWTRSDFGCGNISVTLNGQTRTITGYYYQGTPSCGATYTATFSNLPYGTYSYTASCSGRHWSGTITVSASCNWKRLE